ncbi:Gsk3a [Symbiodinium natans]|uniref:Gsk3a protein n=1 Tax=Symbiodinium natans TaxID=878477 RepID=A0A812JHC4_9DINO|nr:Gsk3a [Symbiodinium natans]
MPMPTHFEVTKTLLEAQMEAVRIYETTLGAEAGHQVALQKAMVTAQLAALQKLEAANGPSAARTAKRGTRKKVAKRSSAIKKRKAKQAAAGSISRGKRRRPSRSRETEASGPKRRRKEAFQRPVVPFGPFGEGLTTIILSFVDVSSKLRAAAASRALHQALTTPVAWNPLVLERDHVTRLLPLLLVHIECHNRPSRNPTLQQLWDASLPAAWEEVSRVEMWLPDPDMNPLEQQSDTSEDEDAEPLPRLGYAFTNPMGLLHYGWHPRDCRRLLKGFGQVQELVVHNINSFWVTHSFPNFRCRNLSTFGYVSVKSVHNTYELHAFANCEPPIVDCSVVAGINVMRARAISEDPEDGKTTLHRHEALFLLESATACKVEKDIHFSNEPYVQITAHKIRKEYKPLLKVLMERFPQSFVGPESVLDGEPSSSYICSRWWRAPELIFGASRYGTSVDWWSCGCITAEMMLGRPLFTGESSWGQMYEIVRALGTPTLEEVTAMQAGGDGRLAGHFAKLAELERPASAWEELLPAFAQERQALELPASLLNFDPAGRLHPAIAMRSSFFQHLPDDPNPLPPKLVDFSDQELSTCDTTAKQKLWALRHMVQARGPFFNGESFGKRAGDEEEEEEELPNAKRRRVGGRPLPLDDLSDIP